MTVFIYKNKKLFDVNFIVPIDTGDIVEYEKFHHEVTPTTDYPYPQYKVIGKLFRHKPAFDGDLLIYLKKV